MRLRYGGKERNSSMKKLVALLIALTMVFSLCCISASAEEAEYHIGIVTGSVSQSEDDRRGAEAFQAMYGEDM